MVLIENRVYCEISVNQNTPSGEASVRYSRSRELSYGEGTGHPSGPHCLREAFLAETLVLLSNSGHQVTPCLLSGVAPGTAHQEERPWVRMLRPCSFSVKSLMIHQHRKVVFIYC